MAEKQQNNSNNISDVIETYIKDILEGSDLVQIKRNDVASLFDVVPSQINYVINTRFNLENGYVVESKRGGGGYIQITHVNFVDDTQVFDDLIDVIGDSIGMPNATKIVQALFEDEVISRLEANLMLAAISKETLRINDKLNENIIRARVLTGMVNRLRYEEGNQIK